MTKSKLIFLWDSRKNFSWYMQHRFCLVEHVFADEINLDELFSRVNCYIAGNNPDELKYLEKAYKLGIEIESFQASGTDVFINFPIDPSVEILKVKMKKIVENEIFSKFSLEEYEYILHDSPFGEATLVFFALKEYKKRCKKKILVATIDSAKLDLFSNCPFVDVTFLIQPHVLNFISIFYSFKNFSKFSTYARDVTFLERNDETLFEQMKRIKYLFDIPYHLALKRYEVSIPEKNMNTAQKIFNEMNLKIGKTIFLNIKGTTSGNLENHPDFIDSLIKKFRAADYEIVSNGKEKIHPDVQNIFLNFWDNVAFVSLCGNIISVLTGWTEATCALISTPLNVQIIFPDPDLSFKSDAKYFRNQFLQNLQSHGKWLIEAYKQGYRIFWSDIFGEKVALGVHAVTDENVLENVFKNIVEN